MMKKAQYCKLYQEQILEADNSLNAFSVCPKCLWDIAEHDHDPNPKGTCTNFLLRGYNLNFTAPTIKLLSFDF